MTQRMYYDCALQAAYMAKEFGVKFCTYWGDECGIIDLKINKKSEGRVPYESAFIALEFTGPTRFTSEGKKGLDNHYKQTEIYDKLYIAPESESIFEPKHGDLNQDGDMFREDIIAYEPEGGWHETSQSDSHRHNGNFDEIIFRQNKHFFSPLIEEK